MMKMFRFYMFCTALALTACSNSGGLLKDLESAAGGVLGGGSSGALTSNEIIRGLKEALSVGSREVVGQLGQQDGFNTDPVIHIPLPATLAKARNVADKVGLAGGFDSLETRLNRAAELAVPKAGELFLGAIRQMSVSDAKGILQGSDDAATKYFRTAMGGSLQTAMRPIVDNSLAEVGAVRTFNEVLGSYRKIPFAPPIEADLTNHVVQLGMDGIFHYIAVEEKAIRENPLKRSSEILQRVFGSL